MLTDLRSAGSVARHDGSSCPLCCRWLGESPGLAAAGVRYVDYGATGEVVLNASMLWWGLLFGAVGLGFFVYGRKQRAIVPLVCGIGLVVFPYFVTGTVWLILVGLALMGLPYFVRV